MAIASRGAGIYNVSGTSNTLNLRWTQLQGTARNDEIVLNKKNIGGWASINMGAGEDTVTLAAGGDYTLQLIGVETIKTTAVNTTLQLRSDATTSTDGSFSAITAMYGVQNITYTAATGAHSTISLGALDDKVTFSGAATNWIYEKAVSTIYAYDLTTNFRVALDSDVEIVNFAGTDLTAAAVTAGKLYLTEDGTSNISGLTLQGAPTEVIFTTGNDTLVATAAQLAAITTFDGLAGTDQITLSAAGTFNTTGKTLTSIEVINGSSGADTITVTTAGITTNGNDGADIITGSTGADTISGGAGADSILGGTGLDTINITETTSAVDRVRIQTVAAANTDTITGFVSGTDILQFASALVSNGTNSATLQTITIANWTGVGGTLGVNNIFIEFIDDTGAIGSCNEALEVDGLLNPAGPLGAQLNAVVGGANEVVLFLHDGQDGYVWHWSDPALGDGSVDAGELTLVATLIGVTNIANGDFALI
jgi:Ca2+-binding RTX toxin-like protein